MGGTPAGHDVVVVGHGLAGLVATTELVRRGRRVALVDQEGPGDLGGQAWWSFGGLFMVDTPEQRRLRVHDSVELAWADWQGSAAFDRLADGPDGPGADGWAQRWARHYVEFAGGEMRGWLHGLGLRWLPTVGWAERGDLRPGGHGNTVPRFHVTWGTGTGVVAPFAREVGQAVADGRVVLHHRHRVDRLLTDAGGVVGVGGSRLAPDEVPRGAPSSREVVGDFELHGPVVIASGGIGGNHDLVRRWWPDRLGTPPATMVTGVPAYVDGQLLEATEAAGARLVNRDRMWHYTEGLRNHSPVWPGHGIRILPGPSAFWVDAGGHRLPAPCLPGFDTLGTLRHLRTDPRAAGHDHSWFVCTRRVLEKEFALSGSEQNPDITSGDRAGFVRSRLLGRGAPAPVEAFVRAGVDVVEAATLEELVAGMDALTGASPPVDAALLRAQLEERDRQVGTPWPKDPQVQAVLGSRRYLGDRLGRTAAPHRFLDPANGPLVALRLHVLTRKSLGGIQTDLAARALGPDGSPVPGLAAAGEAAGFGGGGVHGYAALEGTFLGGCLLTGRTAGRTAADGL